jgi:predicted RNase H-like HicB family nuclease
MKNLILNMKKKVLNFTVLIEKGIDNLYIATVPDIPGCYTQAKTIGQVMDRIKEAIELCLESDKEEIKPLKFVGIQQVEINK